MSNLSTPIETINDAIKSRNPFAIKFVDQHHIWGSSFPDVPEINLHTFETILNAIEKVANDEIPSIGIIITGEKGLGKTQVISRLRHHLQSQKNAFFVYMGNYGDLNAIKSEFLQTLISSLKRIGAEGVTQWQELAANMVFTAKGERSFSVEKLSNLVTQKVSQDPDMLEKWTNIICKKKPELNNPYLVRAILWTLSDSHSPYAISWLSGQELTQAKADQLGLPNNFQKDDSATFKTTCELLSLISHYNNIVFCFDELDDPSCNERGFPRAAVVAGLAKDLRNLVGKCVLLMAMYPATLRDEIKLGQTRGASYDRTADQILELEYLNPDTSVTLVSRWLADFYASKDLIPPHPLYPFNESEIRDIGKEKPTARSVLKWCFDNWKIGENPNIPEPSIDSEKFNPVQAAFENELQAVEESISEYMEDNSVVGDALWIAFCSLVNEEIEGVEIIDVDWIDLDEKTKSSDKGYLHLRIIAKENDEIIKIGVAAILQAGGSSVSTALKRLIDYEKFDFTRGCLVRSHKISKTAQVAQNCIRTLLNEKNGEWVALLQEHIKPLIAISIVFEKSENYDLTEDQVYAFIEENRLTIDNPLVREILSDPSGQEPSGLIDDELPISIPKDSLDDNIEEIEL